MILFDAHTRRELLARRDEGLAAYEALMADADRLPTASAAEAELLAEAEEALRGATEAEAEYFAHLPCVVVSCCPECGAPLERRLDPYGLDGPFWRPDASPEEPSSCPHFACLLGAIDLRRRAGQGGAFAAHVGPGVPYAVPRLLDLPGVALVVSRLELEDGCVAYPLAYFAEEVPFEPELTAGWGRTCYTYVPPEGRPTWRVPSDRWTFDLRPGVEAGRIRWCAPDSDRTALAGGSCPYLDLPGVRAPQVVQGERSWTLAAPDGRPVIPSAFL